MSSSYSYTTEIWPALITIAIVTYLCSYSWRRRHIPAAKPFAVACVFGGFWTLGVILELSAVKFSTQVFWIKFQAIWQLPTGTAIACFILQYAGLGRWLTRRNYALLSLFPLLSVLGIATNDFHHLIWTGFQLNRYVVASHGRLYWVFNSYIYLLGFFNFVVLVRLAIFSPGHRLHVAIILSCQIIARVGYTMEKLDTGLLGPGESVLLVIGLMAVAYSLTLLRFHAIDPVAAARIAALQQMRQGLIVLDLQGRVADFNPMAAAMLGLPENSLRNKRLEEVMPVDADFLERLDSNGTGQTEIVMDEENSARQYTLKLTLLKGRYGEAIGHLILLHDITEQRQAQARILEQQSVVATLQERERLARELHDGIGQVLGYLSMQTQTALKWMHEGNDEKAQSLMKRLVEVAKDAHADVRESILSLKTASGRQWSFIPALREHIGRFQSNYGIRTELLLPPGIEENTFDPGTGVHLLRAIQEALTNARKHSGAQSLKVCVKLDRKKAQITVSDDGLGFDVSRLGRGEGDHHGLAFMRERMTQIGGALNIESRPGAGTVLKLDAPIATYREKTQ